MVRLAVYATSKGIRHNTAWAKVQRGEIHRSEGLSQVVCTDSGHAVDLQWFSRQNRSSSGNRDPYCCSLQ
jgi:hypothetical protein